MLFSNASPLISYVSLSNGPSAIFNSASVLFCILISSLLFSLNLFTSIGISSHSDAYTMFKLCTSFKNALVQMKIPVILSIAIPTFPILSEFIRIFIILHPLTILIRSKNTFLTSPLSL